MRTAMLAAAAIAGGLFVTSAGWVLWQPCLAADAESNPANAAKLKAAEASRKSRQAELARYKTADITKLVGLKVEDIVEMRVARLASPGTVGSRYAPGGLGSPLKGEAIQGVLELCKNAEAATSAAPPLRPNYSLLVKLSSGEALALDYNNYLGASTGGLKSRPLKEALVGLANLNRISVIYFDAGRVTGTLNFHVGPVRSVLRSPEVAASMALNRQGQLVLRLRTFRNRQLVVDDEQAVHYGEAQVFAQKGRGFAIVLLHEP